MKGFTFRLSVLNTIVVLLTFLFHTIGKIQVNSLILVKMLQTVRWDVYDEIWVIENYVQIFSSELHPYLYFFIMIIIIKDIIEYLLAKLKRKQLLNIHDCDFIRAYRDCKKEWVSVFFYFLKLKSDHANNFLPLLVMLLLLKRFKQETLRNGRIAFGVLGHQIVQKIVLKNQTWGLKMLKNWVMVLNNRRKNRKSHDAWLKIREYKVYTIIDYMMKMHWGVFFFAMAQETVMHWYITSIINRIYMMHMILLV